MMHCFKFGLSDAAMKDGVRQLDMRANWGLTVMPIRHSELGLVKVEARPAAQLAQPQPGDQ